MTVPMNSHKKGNFWSNFEWLMRVEEVYPWWQKGIDITVKSFGNFDNLALGQNATLATENDDLMPPPKVFLSQSYDDTFNSTVTFGWKF